MRARRPPPTLTPPFTQGSQSGGGQRIGQIVLCIGCVKGKVAIEWGRSCFGKKTMFLMPKDQRSVRSRPPMARNWWREERGELSSADY